MRRAPECARLLLDKTFTLAPDDLGNNPGQLAAFGCINDPEMYEIVHEVATKMQHDREAMPPACCSVWEAVDFYSDTWSVDHLRYAVEVASVHCDECAKNKVLIENGQEAIRELAPKVENAKPVINRGNVKIDFVNKTIEIMKEIPFENRKAPDTSAEFAEGTDDAVAEILLDLAIILATFVTPDKAMVIEGHTGGTDPKDYWKELAQNRANKIFEVISTAPMPPGQKTLTIEEWRQVAIPEGCPGGGAKVIVKPKKAKGAQKEEAPPDPKAKGKKK
jgi:hypothetical protein